MPPCDLAAFCCGYSQWRAGLEAWCGPGCQHWAHLRSRDELCPAVQGILLPSALVTTSKPKVASSGGVSQKTVAFAILCVMHFFKYLPTAPCQDASGDRVCYTFSSCCFNSGQDINFLTDESLRKPVDVD